MRAFSCNITGCQFRRRQDFLAIFFICCVLVSLFSLTHGNEIANHLHGELIDYLLTVSSHLSVKNHVTLQLLAMKYRTSNYVFDVEYFVLAVAVLNIILRVKSMLKSKLARKQAAVGSMAFKEHCETMCQSMF